MATGRIVVIEEAVTTELGQCVLLPADATKYLDGTGAFSIPGGGGGGITQLTGDVTAGPGSGSQAATLAASGVTAATYGDATHVPQIAVDAKGRITSASNVVISGGGIGAVLFDSTLGADNATIDTGAGGIAGGFHTIVAYALFRGDNATAGSLPNFIVNNDTGGNYDRQVIRGNSAAATAAVANADTALTFSGHGNGGTANYATAVVLTFPNYAGTTFFKSGTLDAATPDGTAGNNFIEGWSVGWRNTGAITRLALNAGGTAKLKAGSRLTIIAW